MEEKKEESLVNRDGEQKEDGRGEREEEKREEKGKRGG